jgi:hypothetical protein
MKIENRLKVALEAANLPYYPGREYRLVKAGQVPTRVSQGWKELAPFEDAGGESLTIMEKEND